MSEVKSLITQLRKQHRELNDEFYRKRIAEGSGEKMRKPGTKGAPTTKAFKEAKKTAKIK